MPLRLVCAWSFLIVAISVLPKLVVAEPAAQPIRGPKRLYLIAEGERSALPERFLWELCELIKQDDDMRARYTGVGVYRIAPEALKIANERAEDPNLRRLAATRDLVESADRRFADSTRCYGDLNSEYGRGKDKTSAELVWLEWMGGPMGDELRAQYGAIQRTARGATDLLEKPAYLRIPGVGAAKKASAISGDESARQVARDLGRRFLHPADASVFDAWIEFEIHAAQRCKVNDTASDCAQINAAVKATLHVNPTTWASVAEIGHLWRLSCAREDETQAPDPESKSVDDQRILTFFSRNRGRCDVIATLSAGACTLELPVHTVRIAAPPLIMRRVWMVPDEDGGLGEIPPRRRGLFAKVHEGPPESVLRTGAELFERRWWPWSSGVLHGRDIGEGRLTVAGERIVKFAENLRSRLRQMGLLLEGRIGDASKLALENALLAKGDSLGYAVLDGDPVCHDLSDSMAAVLAGTVVNWDDWLLRCSGELENAQSSLSTELRASTSLVLRRFGPASNSIYKGIPALGDRDIAIVPAGKPTLAMRIDKPYRPMETYLLSSVDTDKVQSRPVPMILKLSPPPLSIGFGVAAVYAADNGGFSGQLWVPFLGEALTLRLEPYLAFIGHPPVVGLVGGVLLDLAGLVRIVSGRAEPFPIAGELGFGTNLHATLEAESHTQGRVRPTMVGRLGLRIRSGLGDAGPEYRLGGAAWLNPWNRKSTDLILQLFVEVAER